MVYLTKFTTMEQLQKNVATLIEVLPAMPKSIIKKGVQKMGSGDQTKSSLVHALVSCFEWDEAPVVRHKGIRMYTWEQLTIMAAAIESPMTGLSDLDKRWVEHRCRLDITLAHSAFFN